MENETDGKPAVRMKASDRRRQIAQTAFDAIAEEGFEGFRTREVAARAGINSATLHHYFPTKEDLIEGVADHLESLYRSERAPAREAPGDVPVALRQLRQEFADVTFLRRERPNIWAVSREFTLRAPRDKTVANVVTRLNEHWRAQVEHILMEGRDAGVFRADLDPGPAALAVVGALWGSVSLIAVSDTEFEAVCHALETWVLGKNHYD